jgi:glutamate synthase (NADPH/NADH) small chain
MLGGTYTTFTVYIFSRSDDYLHRFRTLEVHPSGCLYKGGAEVKLIEPVSYVGFLYAVFGYYNGTYLHWINSVFFSGYSLAIVILIFGAWVVASEKLRYERFRIAVLTLLVATWWLLVPLLTHSGFLDFHVIGSAAFFAYLGVVFLFGRRADCGWNCTCVGVRDTVGNAFRKSTPRGQRIWKLRHVKWIPLALILIYLFVWEFYAGTPFAQSYYGIFNAFTTHIFFVSLLVIPVTGNRNWCRFLCPWGALYGLVGRVGFYKIEADMAKCTDCGACDRVCEMGVPVSSLIKKSGQVKVADCVGCGRCVASCPTKTLQFKDIRDYVRAFARDFSRLFSEIRAQEKAVPTATPRTLEQS